MRKYICLLPRERKKLDSSLNLLTKSFLGVHCTGVLLKKGKRKPQVTCYWRSMFYHWYCIPIIGWSIDTLYVKEQRSPRLDDTHATVRYKVLMSLKKINTSSLDFILIPSTPVDLRLKTPFSRETWLSLAVIIQAESNRNYLLLQKLIFKILLLTEKLWQLYRSLIHQKTWHIL